MRDWASISCTLAEPVISSTFSLCSISYRVHWATTSCSRRWLVRTIVSSSCDAWSARTRMVVSCFLAFSPMRVRKVVVSSSVCASERGSAVSVIFTERICTPYGINFLESDASIPCANSSRRSLTRSCVTE
jgi:hypothetical protein